MRITHVHLQALLALELETTVFTMMPRIRATAYVLLLLLLRLDNTRHLTHIVFFPHSAVKSRVSTVEEEFVHNANRMKLDDAHT